MISKVRWKHEEETHGSLCIFICPYVPSVHQFTRCSSSFSPSPPFFVCQQSSFPPTPPQFILSLSVPYCTLSLPAPPAHLRWIEWTLCSKINFEMNEAIAVCACSLILCQKMEWRLCLDLFTAKALHFLELPRLMLWYLETSDSPQCQKYISL